MSRRFVATLAAALIVGGLLAPVVRAADLNPPDCPNDTFATDEDSPGGGSVQCTADATITYSVDTDASHGILVLDSDGSFTYDPDSDYFGGDSFDYIGTDEDGSSTPATVTITITPVNDQPSFTKGGDQSVSENAGAQAVTGWATAISEGPPNESSQTVSFLVSNNNSGLFSGDPAISPSGTLTYTPAASKSGSATVSVRLQDSGGTANGGDDTSPTQTFAITVNGVNDPPSFTKGASQTDLEDAGSQSVSSWATAISPGPPDENGQTVTFVIDSATPDIFSSGPAVSSSGTLAYTPTADANGVSTIVLHAHDDAGGNDDSPTQSFTITITAVNDEPSFTKGTPQTVGENAGAQTVTGWATAISEGPGNESGQNVSFVVTNNNPSLFSAQPAISPTGTLTYTPAPSQNGSATVSVKLQDNGGTANGGDDTSPTQTFTITVSGVNDPPSFTKGANQTDLEDAGPHTVTGWATAISRGPPDESGQTVNFIVDTGVPDLFSSGPAISPSGTLTYTPAPNATGTSTVSVAIHDNGGTANGGVDTSATVTFTITLTPVNDPPSFSPGPNQTAAEDSGLHTVPGWATNILEGPVDEAAQVVDFVIDGNTNPALFSVAPAVSPTGELTYTPAPDANGSATIQLHAHDNGGTANGGDNTSSSQAFTISISGVNDPPTCLTANDATFVNAALSDSIGACADVDGNSLAYALVTPPTHGITDVNVNGSFTYNPVAGFLGVDSFTFKANDGTVDSNVATMTIQVQADPIARNDIAPTDFPAILQGSGPTAIPVLVNDVDKQGGPLLIVSVTQGSKGSVSITGGGTGLTYDPTALNSGNDSFRYTIVDNQGRSNSGIVVVVIAPDTVKPVLTAPTLAIVRPATLGATTSNVRIRWSASDVWIGLKSVKLQQKTGTGAWKTVTLASPKAKSVARTLTLGKRYQYRVRATDVVGNGSPWTYSAVFVLGRAQETSAAISYAGSWRTSRSAVFSGGSDRYSTRAGASALLTFTGEGVAWVSSRSATRGSAQVFIDGSLAGTVNLHGATKHRQIVFSAAWPASGAHTIQIVVLGTLVHPRVDLDAFLVAR